jgi:hypothetical protein
MKSETRIRDFIYLDVDRLYSLYSQLFEGVAGEIIQSVVNSAASSDSQKGAPLSGLSVETQVAEVSRRTESRFLHDEMYNQFERRLGTVVVVPTGLTRENFRDELRGTFIVKVSGPVEIEDYSRLHEFMGRFNDLGAAISYAKFSSAEMQAERTEMETKIESISDRNQKSILRQKLKELTDPKRLAQASGLHHDEKNLANLRLWIEMFQREGFDIIISPREFKNAFGFRGVVNKRWLRLNPDMIRALYGGAVWSPWTMVGQVTYLPGDGVAVDAESAIFEREEPNDPDNPSMRDPFRQMFRTSRVLERAFFESRQRTEVILSPLAVYREAELAQ